MDAYGYNALSGFFGSSSRKDKKKEEIAYLEKMYNLQNQQMQAEEQARFQSQQLIDQSYKIAEQLTTGDHTRKSDKEAVEKVNSLQYELPAYRDEFLEYHELTDAQFVEYTERVRNLDIWHKVKGQWRLKHELS